MISMGYKIGTFVPVLKTAERKRERGRKGGEPGAEGGEKGGRKHGAEDREQGSGGRGG